MKRFFLIISTVLMLNFIGCGGNSSEEAKELLQRILTLVGIPQEIVVNICQDGNDNSICDEGEIQTKITLNKDDTPKTILEKIKFQPNGTYLLEHYDPTKKIIMEIEDNAKLKNTGQRVTLTYLPSTQELSILQALVDRGFLKQEEYNEINKSSKARVIIDEILLENLFYNQTILEEQNLTKQDATTKNLEFIAEGLHELNITKIVKKLDNCEVDNSCKEIKIEINKNTEINKKKAEITVDNNSTEGTEHKEPETTTVKDNNSTEISSENNTRTENNNNSSSNNNANPKNSEKTERNVADGYIIKLSSRATATCPNGASYQSELTVGTKGKITFKGVTLDDECIITVPSGATIDSNNNGTLDNDDKVLNFWHPS